MHRKKTYVCVLSMYFSPFFEPNTVVWEKLLFRSDVTPLATLATLSMTSERVQRVKRKMEKQKNRYEKGKETTSPRRARADPFRD